MCTISPYYEFTNKRYIKKNNFTVIYSYVLNVRFINSSVKNNLLLWLLLEVDALKVYNKYTKYIIKIPKKKKTELPFTQILIIFTKSWIFVWIIWQYESN